MEVPDLAAIPLRVAIITRSHMQRRCLRELLEEHHIEIVANDVVKRCLPGDIDNSVADVLLVDLDDSNDRDASLLEILIDQASLPILFNDAGATRIPTTTSGRAWGRRLAEKLYDLADRQSALLREHEQPSQDTGDEIPEAKPPQDADNEDGLVLVDAGSGDDDELETDKVRDPEELIADIELVDEQLVEQSIAELGLPNEEVLQASADAVSQAGQDDELVEDGIPATDEDPATVWVLGASIGGPQAVKQFLAALPPDMPASFVLAQHIGGGFVSLLAEQLGRVSYLKINCAAEGMRLQENHLLIAPVEKQIDFTDTGNLHLKSVMARSIYSPSIDAVMKACAKRYRGRCRAIVFSGMGNDGRQGAREIVEHGGEVWAQDAGSCVISSMADSARGAGVVSYTGTPEELAERLVTEMERIRSKR
jgi:chemotaxis response regulator CheB